MHSILETEDSKLESYQRDDVPTDWLDGRWLLGSREDGFRPEYGQEYPMTIAVRYLYASRCWADTAGGEAFPHVISQLTIKWGKV
jgi:hypothetical protein